MATKKKKTRSIDSGWIDISVPLTDGMLHWPGDPPSEIKRVKDIKGGDEYNLTHISTSVHAGTHMDAPCHFTKTGASIDRMPVAAAMGKVKIIEIQDNESVKVGEIRSHRIREGERIIFKTRNSRQRWNNKPFNENFVYISTEAARFLAERKIRLLGVDYLSIGGMHNGIVVHQAILNAGIFVIEGLDLFKIEPGNYEIVCLPIKIKGSDGAMARALIRAI